MRKLFAVLLLAPAAAQAAPISTGPQWPERFFLGETRGEGTLKILFAAAHAVHVKGMGHVDPDGTLILDQRVEEEGKPVRNRVWHLRGTPQGQYAGTLSDASTPVEGEAETNRLHLRFKAKGGYSIDQVLTLQQDGTTALNHMEIKKFGLTVATLEETIRHIA